jgi:hypothetical protein
MFHVASTQERGRVLIASCEINEGEDVIVEEAFAYCTHEWKKSCITCLTRLDSTIMRHCEKCNILFCSDDRCLHSHDYLLCSSMNQLREIAEVVHIDLGLICLIFTICVNAQKTGELKCDTLHDSVLSQVKQLDGCNGDDDSYTLFDLVCSLETHREDIDPEVVFTFRKSSERLFGVLRNALNVSEDKLCFDDETIIDLFCIVFVNAHGLCPPGFTADIGTGLFPIVSLISHDCTPNCCFVTIGHTIHVRSIRNIQKSEELTISYVDLVPPTHLRRKALLQSKYFVCECSRCISPTENNRYIRGYKCNSCPTGYFVPTYAFDDEDYKRKDMNLNFQDIDHSEFENALLEGEDSEDVTFDDAFDAFDNLYGDEVETNHDLIQIVTHWKCDRCNAQSREHFESLEKQFIQVLNEYTNLDTVSKLYEEHKLQLHPNHFLLFEYWVKKLIMHDLNKFKLDDAEVNSCFENLIQITERILPEYHFEKAEYYLRYSKHLKQTNQNEVLSHNLYQEVLQQYHVLYPSHHQIHQTSIE